MARRRQISRANAERAGESLVESLGIHEPPVDVERIAASLSMRVVYESLSSDTSAVLIREPDGAQYIGVNATHSLARKRFSIAHEIGHAQLHFEGRPATRTEAVFDRPLEMMFRDGIASEGSNRVEIEANSFAAGLLMPAAMVRSEFRVLLTDSRQVGVDQAVDTLAMRFAVSTQAMRFRLINLGLVDPA